MTTAPADPGRARPQGPKGRLLIGHVGMWNRDALGFLTRCAREFGDVVPIRLGPARMVVLSHPDLVEQVLVAQHASFDKGESHRLTRSLLGNGLLSSEGDFRQDRVGRRLYDQATEMSRLEYARHVLLTPETRKGRAPVWPRAIMCEWLCLSVGVLRAVLRSPRDLALDNLLLRQQLVVALRAQPRPKLQDADGAVRRAALRFADTRSGAPGGAPTPQLSATGKETPAHSARHAGAPTGPRRRPWLPRGSPPRPGADRCARAGAPTRRWP